jgi:hypothetical protein
VPKTEHRSIVLDKSLDEATLKPLFAASVRTAKIARPSTPYEGEHPNDEDFTHVLMVSWEDYALTITSDGAFFEKARQFQDGLARRKRDRCMRGVIIVPKWRDEQVRLLRAFIDGSLTVRYKGRPVTLEDVAAWNLGVDLRTKVPVAIELCDCERFDD